MKTPGNFRKYRVQCRIIVPDRYQLSFDCDAPGFTAAASQERSHEDVAVIAESERHVDYDHLGHGSMLNAWR